MRFWIEPLVMIDLYIHRKVAENAECSIFFALR